MAKELKLPTLLALPVLLAATYFEHYYIWGFLFMFWSVLSVRAGDAFLVEPIAQDEYPILFWTITIMWFGFGLWYVIGDLHWRF